MGIVEFCKLMAKSMLHAKSMRRKLVFRLLLVVVLLFFLGVFVIGGWLEKDLFRFAIFWMSVFVLTAFLILFAVYDILRSGREVTLEHNKEVSQQLREIAKIIKEEQEKSKEEKEGD